MMKFLLTIENSTIRVRIYIHMRCGICAYISTNGYMHSIIHTIHISALYEHIKEKNLQKQANYFIESM